MEANGNTTKHESSANGHRYSFDGFELDPANRILQRDGAAIPLPAKVFDVLLVFAGNPGRLLEKDELIEKVWRQDFVEEGNLARHVSTLRKALGDNGKDRKYIVTVQGRGYRFVADVSTVKPDELAHVATGTAPVSQRTEIPVRTRSTYISRRLLWAIAVAAVPLAVVWIGKTRFFTPANQIKSLAVLPLKPLTVESRDPVYELGIADSLILKLSSVKELIVRPLSATRKYVSLDQDPLAAGREQQVDYVLASNYQLADGRIRLTAQLVNVKDGSVASVFKCDEKCTDIFAAQDAISEKVGTLVLTRLSTEQNRLLAKDYTTNEEAYRLYLQGKYLADRRKLPDAEKAIGFFEQAVTVDPNYGLAYAGLAYAHRTVSSLGDSPHEEYPKSLAAVAKALELDDSLAEAHAILAEIKFTYEWDFPGAEREHLKAIALNPNSPQAHLFFGFYLSILGRQDQAISEMKTSIQLDPTNLFYGRALGQVLYYARRYDEAIAQLQRIVEMDSHFSSAYHWIQWAYEMKGDYDKAFEWFLQNGKQYGATTEDLQLAKAVYAKSGWLGILRQDAQTIDKQYINRAGIYAQLGEKEQAFAALEKAFEARELNMVFTQVEPRLDLLRSDPRFDELMHRVGLR